jgi:hypothetical protein
LVDSVIFYGNIIPLDRDNHRDVSLDVAEDRFGFAGNSHIVPAVFDEFIAAAPHVPIVFLPGVNAPVAVFLVGLRSGKNALVGSEGRWLGNYIPAYLRRYPLMFGEIEGRDPITCIDSAYALPDGKDGERMFTPEGAERPALVERIALMNEFFLAAKRGEAAVATLVQLDLLRPVTIDAKFESGESLALHGMLTVDVGRLNELSGDDFLRLRSEGLLQPIYAHLMSLNAIDAIRKLS